MKLIKPKFWDKKYITLLAIILFPLTIVYNLIILLRKTLSNSKKFPILTICIGNIYLGGTGKTPVALKIFKILTELNRNPVIIKKKYVNQEDEVSLIKKYSKILVSERRSEGLMNAIEKKFDVAILDDGYQDLEIKKDLNIVCFHSKQGIGNGFVLPAGPLRESLRELNICDLVIINGKKDFEFEQKLKQYNRDLQFCYYNYFPKNIVNYKNKKLIAFAGIGNPQNFFDLLKENHLNIVKEISFPDHYNYNEQDLNKLESLEIQYNAKLITTEKDFLRMSQFTRKKYDFIKIDIKFDNEEILTDILKKKL